MNSYRMYNKFLLGFSLATLMLLTTINQLNAQHMLGYTDAQGDFYVNDGGKMIHLEHQRIISLQPAANSIAYVNNSGNLIYYANHEQQPLNVSNPNFYKNTDYYLYYSSGASFSVYNGTMRKYLGNIQQNPYAFGDSIAAFHDFSSFCYAFYRDEFIEIEKQPVKKIVAGDNIIAYVNHLDQFKIFYEGNKIEIDDYFPIKIEAGANIVAFIDTYNYLKVFYKGELTELHNVSQINCLEIPGSTSDDGIESYCNALLAHDMTTLMPVFLAGDNIVAYIDDAAQFNVFSEGNIIQLESQPPLYYVVKDNLLWYIDNNNFLKVFNNGELSVVETYRPQKILADNNVLVYTDLDNRLKAFYQGKIIEVSTNIVIDFSLNNTLIMYNEIPNKYKFYYLPE